MVATGDYYNKQMNHNSFVLSGLWGPTFSSGVVLMMPTDDYQLKYITIILFTLYRRSVELAHSLGYKAVKTEATGLYSRYSAMVDNTTDVQI